MSKEICKRWRANPSKSPITGFMIKAEGPSWKKLDQSCTKIECDEWQKDKTINPKTGKTIKPFKTTWKKLEKNCREKHMYSPRKSKLRDIFAKDYKFITPECETWYRNKNVNPFSGNALKTGGKYFQYFQKECDKQREFKVDKQRGFKVKDIKISQYEDPTRRGKFKKDYTFETPECKQWLLDDSINPFTKRKIQYRKGTWQYFETECTKQRERVRSSPIRSNPEWSYIPPKRGEKSW